MIVLFLTTSILLFRFVRLHTTARCLISTYDYAFIYITRYVRCDLCVCVCVCVRVCVDGVMGVRENLVYVAKAAVDSCTL